MSKTFWIIIFVSVTIFSSLMSYVSGAYKGYLVGRESMYLEVMEDIMPLLEYESRKAMGHYK